MINPIIGTPEGTRDSLFSETKRWRMLEKTLSDYFIKRGYSEVITPVIEYYDLFANYENGLPQEFMYKLIDRNGQILVIRPDNTTPIARVAATRLNNTTYPKRLFYMQKIYRSDTIHAGRRSEIIQAGIELLGAKGEKADLEVIMIAYDSLKTCGLDNIYFGIGHADILGGLFADLGISGQKKNELCGLIKVGNYPAMYDMLEPYKDNKSCKTIKDLLHMFGGEEVLDEAEKLTAHIKTSVDAIAYLRRMCAYLKELGLGDKIKIDMGTVNPLNYYTGLVIRGYVRGFGQAVLTGGRYDNLVARFGKDLPAVGFAMDVDAAMRMLPMLHRNKLEKIIHADSAFYYKAFSYMEGLVPETFEISCHDSLEDTMKLAREKNVPVVVLVGDEITEIPVDGLEK